MNKIFRCVLVVGIGIICSLGSTMARAQISDVTPTSKGDQLHGMIAVKVRYARASIIASWIDPNYVKPDMSVFSQKKLSANETLELKKYYEKPILLPEGIQQVVAVDVQNLIIVYGLNTALEKAKVLIEQLDKPMTLIELRLQVVSTDDTGVQSLGVGRAIQNNFTASAQDSEKFQSRLDNLREAGKVEIIQDERISRLTSVTTSRNLNELTTTKVTNENNFKGLFSPLSTPILLFTFESKNAAKTISLVVLPSIDRNGLINLSVEYSQPLPVIDVDKKASTQSENQIVFDHTIFVGDNQTVCVGGLREVTTEQRKLEAEKLDARHQLYFVTAEIFQPGGRTKPEIIFAGP